MARVDPTTTPASDADREESPEASNLGSENLEDVEGSADELVDESMPKTLHFGWTLVSPNLISFDEQSGFFPPGVG